MGKIINVRYVKKFARHTSALIAQRLERSAVNRKVVGSIPTGGVF